MLFKHFKLGRRKAWAAIAGSVPVLVGLAPQARSQVEPVRPPELTLSISVVLAEAKPTMGPTLLFQATNNSGQELTVPDAGVSRSPIVL